MDPKFGIFMIIASVLTMAVYSSSANFVSADSSECFGTSSQGYVICSHTVTLSNGDEHSFLVECSKNKDGLWNCQKIGSKVMPPGIEDSIKKYLTPEVLGKSTK